MAQKKQRIDFDELACDYELATGHKLGKDHAAERFLVERKGKGITFELIERIFPGSMTEEKFKALIHEHGEKKCAKKPTRTGTLWSQMSTEEKKAFCRTSKDKGWSDETIGKAAGVSGSRIANFRHQHFVRMRGYKDDPDQDVLLRNLYHARRAQQRESRNTPN